MLKFKRGLPIWYKEHILSQIYRGVYVRKDKEMSRVMVKGKIIKVETERLRLG